MSNEKQTKSKKRFKDTKVFKFIKDKAPSLLGEVVSFAGDVSDIELLNKIGDKLKGTTALSQEEKELALEYLKFDLAELEAVTARWEADMGSDNWLAKSVRPLTLIYLILFLSIVIIWDSASINFNVKESYISLLEILSLTVVGAYFGFRTYEKVRNNRVKQF